MEERAKRARWPLWLGAIGLGAYVLGRLEARSLVRDERDLPLFPARLPEPIRLLHVSDLQVDWYHGLRWVDRAIDAMIACRPDLVCITGDFVNRKIDRFYKYAGVLNRLARTVPTFACLGNHDGGAHAFRRFGGYPDTSVVRALLLESGVTLLHNRSVCFVKGGDRLRLVGVGDIQAGECDPRSAFEEVRPEEDGPVVVLSHNPDSKSQLRDAPWDLMLSGHTHGGEVRLGSWAPLAPVRDKRFVAGLLPWGDRWIHVSRGVGSTKGLRFNCPPHVTLLKLH